MPSLAHNSDIGGVLVIAAVRTEAAPLLKDAVRTDEPNVWRIDGRDAVLCVTGMGGRRMAETAERLIDRHRPSLLINVGFAAGLHASFQGGDIVSVHEVMREWAGALHLPAVPPGVRDALMELSAARLLTSSQLVTSREAKRQLALSHGAAVLDMETYDLALLARERDLPLVVLKAVSDPLDLSLPPQVATWVDADGHPQVRPAALFALTHPHRIATLLALKRYAARGAAGLASHVRRMLDAAAVHASP